jgi:hypothetical protein
MKVTYCVGSEIQQLKKSAREVSTLLKISVFQYVTSAARTRLVEGLAIAKKRGVRLT